VNTTELLVFVAVVLVLATSLLWAPWYAKRLSDRRERIDIEAHEAYMNGGGYPAYFAVYRKYGIIKKESK
jgi:hypothetical protein